MKKDRSDYQGFWDIIVAVAIFLAVATLFIIPVVRYDLNASKNQPPETPPVTPPPTAVSTVQNKTYKINGLDVAWDSAITAEEKQQLLSFMDCSEEEYFKMLKARMYSGMSTELFYEVQFKTNNQVTYVSPFGSVNETYSSTNTTSITSTTANLPVQDPDEGIPLTDINFTVVNANTITLPIAASDAGVVFTFTYSTQTIINAEPTITSLSGKSYVFTVPNITWTSTVTSEAQSDIYMFLMLSSMQLDFTNSTQVVITPLMFAGMEDPQVAEYTLSGNTVTITGTEIDTITLTIQGDELVWNMPDIEPNSYYSAIKCHYSYLGDAIDPVDPPVTPPPSTGNSFVNKTFVFDSISVGSYNMGNNFETIKDALEGEGVYVNTEEEYLEWIKSQYTQAQIIAFQELYFSETEVTFTSILHTLTTSYRTDESFDDIDIVIDDLPDELEAYKDQWGCMPDIQVNDANTISFTLANPQLSFIDIYGIETSCVSLTYIFKLDSYYQTQSLGSLIGETIVAKSLEVEYKPGVTLEGYELIEFASFLNMLAMPYTFED